MTSSRQLEFPILFAGKSSMVRLSGLGGFASNTFCKSDHSPLVMLPFRSRGDDKTVSRGALIPGRYDRFRRYVGPHKKPNKPIAQYKAGDDDSDQYYDRSIFIRSQIRISQ